jgi:pyruvate/2-oxoglutarate dehydrogenase complex dihydrolipoamide dehydrogenase (E3) component
MIRAANLLAEGRRIPGMAGQVTVTPQWAPVAGRIRDEATDTWDDKVAVERLEAKGARFVRGWAVLDRPRRVVVGDRGFEPTRALVLNPGAKPWAPPIPGLADVPYWNNRGAIAAESAPESLLVLGGGSIGVELGQMFSRFGTRVTMVEGAPRLVALEEPEASQLIAGVFADEGIALRTGAKISGVSYDGERFTMALDGGESLSAERLLVATGRRPDLGALGVGHLGLDQSARAIDVDGRLRVAPGVWAVGDVTGKGAFTHVSMYQANIATLDILGREPDDAEYHAVPRVTFTDPEVGSVGMSEAAARQAGLEVAVGWSDVSTSARGWIHKAGNAGFIKLVEDRGAGVLVGATSAGPTGGEVLGLLTLAVHARVPTTTLRRMIYAYPTFHRAIESALDDLGS